MKKSKIACLLMAAAMGTMLIAGCGSQGGNQGGNDAQQGAQEVQSSGESEPQAPSSDEEQGAGTGGEGSYSLITNTWGAGAYPLDEIVRADNYFCDTFGFSLDVANNEFTADKVVSQLESQLANNPDGVLFLGNAQTTFVPAVQAINSKNLPYAFDSNLPEQQILDQCLDSENFCGGVSANQVELGRCIAEIAIADGNKTAIITAAAMGDYSHDNRIKGFTEYFEANGGKVLQETHSADPSEAVAKTTDLITANPDADCIYAPGGDYLSAVLSVKESRSDLDMMVYGNDTDPTLLDAIEKGDIRAITGGQAVGGSLAMTLVVNYLDGHKIVDENGKAPVFTNLNIFTVTTDNVAGFKKFYDSGENFISEETYSKLLYRNNPDVSFDTYNEVMEGYADSVYERLP